MGNEGGGETHVRRRMAYRRGRRAAELSTRFLIHGRESVLWVRIEGNSTLLSMVRIHPSPGRSDSSDSRRTGDLSYLDRVDPEIGQCLLPIERMNSCSVEKVQGYFCKEFPRISSGSS